MYLPLPSCGVVCCCPVRPRRPDCKRTSNPQTSRRASLLASLWNDVIVLLPVARVRLNWLRQFDCSVVEAFRVPYFVVWRRRWIISGVVTVECVVNCRHVAPPVDVEFLHCDLQWYAVPYRTVMAATSSTMKDYMWVVGVAQILVNPRLFL